MLSTPHPANIVAQKSFVFFKETAQHQDLQRDLLV
jgi:hypothetical protein